MDPEKRHQWDGKKRTSVNTHRCKTVLGCGGWDKIFVIWLVLYSQARSLSDLFSNSVENERWRGGGTIEGSHFHSMERKQNELTIWLPAVFEIIIISKSDPWGLTPGGGWPVTGHPPPLSSDFSAVGK